MAKKTRRMLGLLFWLVVILLLVASSEKLLTRTRSLLTEVLIYAGVFGVGWLLGRYRYGSKA